MYIDGLLMPVMPRELHTRYRGRNTRVALIDGGEVTQFRAGEQAEFRVTLCLPRRVYPFAQYEGAFLEPEVFVAHFLQLRAERRAFRFIIARVSPGGSLLTDTNVRVSLEEFECAERAEDGDDITAQLVLRAFQEYKTVRVDENRIVTRPGREQDHAPVVRVHVVVRGDNLWNLARQFLGDPRRYREIFELNRGEIRDPHWIFPGQVLRLPER